MAAEKRKKSVGICFCLFQSLKRTPFVNKYNMGFSLLSQSLDTLLPPKSNSVPPN